MDHDAIAAMAERLERLERAHRLWKRTALLGIVFALLLASVGLLRPRRLSAGQGDEAAPAPTDPLTVVRARLNMSQQALDLIRRSAQRGAQVINQREDLYRWSYRLLGDQIYVSMSADDPPVSDPEVYLAVSHARPNPERTAAFEAHLKRMRDWEELMRPLYRQQVLSTIDFLDIQSYRLEAELWLARERIKERKEQESRDRPSPAERKDQERKP
jgi:hypothetical protein